jgi:hypothetical protein
MYVINANKNKIIQNSIYFKIRELSLKQIFEVEIYIFIYIYGLMIFLIF